MLMLRYFFRRRCSSSSSSWAERRDNVVLHMLMVLTMLLLGGRLSSCTINTASSSTSSRAGRRQLAFVVSSAKVRQQWQSPRTTIPSSSFSSLLLQLSSPTTSTSKTARQLQTSSSTANTNGYSSMIASSSDDNKNTVVKRKKKIIPFLVEELPSQQQPPKKDNNNVFREISDMCITAFFNDHDDAQQPQTTNTTPVWRQWQLMYLRQLQTSDLERRHNRRHTTNGNSNDNVMFVARRVIPATSSNVQQTPLILDTHRIQNLDDCDTAATMDEDWVRGEIVGFVEVTKRPYGLGDTINGGGESSRGDVTILPTTFQQLPPQDDGFPLPPPNGDDGNDHDDAAALSPSSSLSPSSVVPYRPVLTNLSVKSEFRQSGVGSALMQQSEKYVQDVWKDTEMILEVEDDNVKARNFYEKRGYQIVLEDPASRRYDTSGFWLRQVRCKRQVLRKNPLLSQIYDLTSSNQKNKNGASLSTTNSTTTTSSSAMTKLGKQMLQKLRDNVLASVLR